MANPELRAGGTAFVFLFLLSLVSLSSRGLGGTVAEGNAFDDQGRPQVALTFDDGPHGTLTPRLLDILHQTKTPATFYVVGRMIQQSPDILQRMAREGHEIGNHTWSHPDLRKLSPDKIKSELKKTDEAIYKATGMRSYSMRPPYGAISRRVLDSIPPENTPVVMWTVDPQDWKKPGSDVIVKRITEACRPGAILLLHDIHEGTIGAVEEIIGRLREQGYRFVTVSQILTSKNSISLE
jgi:peptidoglycan/xylan/chitin deacetylase (PgdA/CDA1 family)